MKASTALVTVALAALALAAGPQGLERKGKAGDKAEYSLLLDLKYAEGASTFRAAVSEETKAASEAGFEVARTYKDAVVVVDTSEYKQTMPPYTVSYDKSGQVQNAVGDETGPDSMRFLRLWSFVAPEKAVETGANWKVAQPENKDFERPGFEMDCTFAGIEAMTGFDCAKVTFTAKETGDSKARSSGTFWVRLTDGATVKVEAVFNDSPSFGFPVEGKVSYALKP